MKDEVVYCRCYPGNIEVSWGEGVSTVDFNGLRGELTESNWRDALSDDGYPPHVIDEVVDRLGFMNVLFITK